MSRFLASIPVLIPLGCGVLAPQEPAPLPPESPTAAPVGVRVAGVVTDRWGYIVPDAMITVRTGSPHSGVAGDAQCDDATHLPTRTRSGPTGEFAVLVEAGRREPFLACLEVEAIPPRRFGLRENVAVVPSAAFTAAGAGGGGAPVTVRVVVY